MAFCMPPSGHDMKTPVIFINTACCGECQTTRFAACPDIAMITFFRLLTP